MLVQVYVNNKGVKTVDNINPEHFLYAEINENFDKYSPCIKLFPRKTVVSDEDFEAGLRHRFGRDLPPEAMETAIRVDVEEAPAPKVSEKKKGAITINDIKKYIGDDVKFHPNKK